jgi:hypothetical protein
MRKWMYGGWIVVAMSFVFGVGCLSSSSTSTQKAETPAPSGTQQTAPSAVKADTQASPAQGSAPSAAPTQPDGKSNSTSTNTLEHQESTVKAPPVPKVEPSKTASNTGATPDQIKGKYENQLVQLKGYYISQLQSLHDQAVAAKKSGQSNSDIYNKYAQRAMNLQEDSQAKVNQILFQMKDEMKAQNLPTDHVNELRSSYYAEMDKAKESMTAKTKSYLGL